MAGDSGTTRRDRSVFTGVMCRPLSRVRMTWVSTRIDPVSRFGASHLTPTPSAPDTGGGDQREHHVVVAASRTAATRPGGRWWASLRVTSGRGTRRVGFAAISRRAWRRPGPPATPCRSSAPCSRPSRPSSTRRAEPRSASSTPMVGAGEGRIRRHQSVYFHHPNGRGGTACRSMSSDPCRFSEDPLRAIRVHAGDELFFGRPGPFVKRLGPPPRSGDGPNSR
jgi:hypothetical protein